MQKVFPYAHAYTVLHCYSLILKSWSTYLVYLQWHILTTHSPNNLSLYIIRKVIYGDYTERSWKNREEILREGECLDTSKFPICEFTQKITGIVIVSLYYICCQTNYFFVSPI